MVFWFFWINSQIVFLVASTFNFQILFDVFLINGCKNFCKLLFGNFWNAHLNSPFFVYKKQPQEKRLGSDNNHTSCFAYSTYSRIPNQGWELFAHTDAYDWGHHTPKKTTVFFTKIINK